MDWEKTRLWLVTNGVAAVLLLFFSVPLMILLYAGAAGGIGGLIAFTPLLLIQYPLYRLFKWLFTRGPQQ